MFRKSRRKPGRGPVTKQTGPRFVALPDHRRRRLVVLRTPGTLAPRKTLLVVLAALTLSAVTLVGSVKAEDEPDQEKHAAACTDAEPVWEGTQTGTLQTDLFETGTGRFVVSYKVLDLEKGDRMPALYATIEDERGRTADSGKIPGPVPGGALMEQLKPNEGRYVVDAMPSSYRLNIEPQMWGKRYAVLVEECGVPEVS